MFVGGMSEKYSMWKIMAIAKMWKYDILFVCTRQSLGRKAERKVRTRPSQDGAR